jgi:hypothetical protein
MIWTGSSDDPTTSLYPMQGEGVGPLSNKKQSNLRALWTQNSCNRSEENKERRTESDNKMFTVCYIPQFTTESILKTGVHEFLIDKLVELFFGLSS